MPSGPRPSWQVDIGGVNHGMRASAGNDGFHVIVGYDISSLQEVEAGGGTYSDEGKVEPLEKILAAHGATHARLRLWVDPVPPHCSVPQVLNMARRVEEAGLKLLLDFHYCDFWADPGKQPTPARWLDQEPATLADTIYEYTATVLHTFRAAGIPPDMVQVGNEITNGMLWPQGQLYVADQERWDEFVLLLKAGIAAVRDTFPAEGQVAVMVHIDRGGDNAGSRYFLDHILSRGTDFDLIGLSYYPWWHGPVSDLHTNVHDLAHRYDRPIIVVETAYPWTLDDHDDGSNMVTGDTLLPAAFPPTIEGQRSFLQHLRSILEHAPNGRGAGLMYWEPAWLPGISLEPDTGNPWDNLTLFGPEGSALPSLRWLEQER
jgi:arabinogalactan endo-1,4-beta-galactosidase